MIKKSLWIKTSTKCINVFRLKKLKVEDDSVFFFHLSIARYVRLSGNVWELLSRESEAPHP